MENSHAFGSQNPPRRRGCSHGPRRGATQNTSKTRFEPASVCEGWEVNTGNGHCSDAPDLSGALLGITVYTMCLS